ncbi:MAG: hypothetical protein AAGB93_14025 [Planctomycetota bacterium]
MLRTALLRLAVLSAALHAPALGQTFTYAVDPSATSIQLSGDLVLDFDGDLRGVFDDGTNNPTGTRTIAGLFGDPGTNDRIPLSLDLGLAVDLGGAVVGGFTLDLDVEAGTATVSGLDLSIGAGVPSSLDLELTFVYDTFRTVSPTSLFLGGIPLTLPLGSVEATQVALVQSALGAGTATASATAGTFDVAVLVPVELAFEVDLGGIFGGEPREGGGGTTPIGPIPLVLPIVGTLDLAACDSALVAAEQTSFDDVIPSPVPIELEDLPFDLPTILPPGQTANLLLTVGLEGIGLSLSLDSTLAASADDGRVEDVCAGVANSTGAGAPLKATGSTSVSVPALTFVATGLPADSFGFLLMSRTEDDVPGFGGSQGTLCVGEPCFRFSQSVQNSGLLGEIAFAPDFDDLPMGQQFVPGEAWVFQYWYRDANPGPTSNTTGAVRVTFCR